MRILFYLLTFAVCSSASGQDFCKNIKKEVSPDKKIFDYASPFDPQEVTPIKVTRSINIDPDYESDNFLMIFQVTGDLDGIYTKSAEGDQIEKEETKLVVEFTDKTQMVDDTLRVSHDVTNDKLQSIRIIYYPLDDNNVKDLMTKKIAKFSIAGHEKTVSPADADAIMHYVECIKKVK